MSGNFLNYIKMSRTLSMLNGDGRISLQSVPGSRSSSRAEVRTSGFLSSTDMELGIPLEFQ